MRNPSFGEVNMGALAGAVAGSFGGLFAVGIPPAIVGRSLTYLFSAPIFALISWVFCFFVGFLLGGQLGPRLADLMKSDRAEIVGGAIGGLVPVVLSSLWSLWVTLH